MTEIVELECPGCGRPLTTDVKECPACHRPVVISSFNSVYSMTAEEVNKYANSFNKALQNNPDNRALNASIAMCYLKLKMYDKALPAFEKAIEDNFDNSETYFYAAVCSLKGGKAFLAQREEIDKIEKYISAAIMVEPRGIYYLLWAYIKLDYYERKYLKTSPNYKEMLNKSIECGCTQADSEMLFSILDVPCPDKIKLEENTVAAQSETSIEKKSWWTLERIVIVAAASFIFVGLMFIIFERVKNKETIKTSYAEPSTKDTKDQQYVIDLVNWWNDIHNSKKTDDCVRIYAAQVKYYQQIYTPAQIAKTKRDLFTKTPSFKQELSDRQITVIGQNTMKVHFNKKVWTSSKDTPKNYPSYLVVNRDTKGLWWIVEESDDITDANQTKKSKKK